MRFTQRGVIVLALVGIVTGSWGCEKQEPTTTINPTVTEKTQELAADKTLTAEVMRQSFMRGVFDDAFALAIHDSGLAEAAWITLTAEPRFASRIGVQQPTRASRSTQRSGHTTISSTPNKDILDQAEDAAKKANERLDQAGRVKKEAEEAKKKIDDIFKP